MSPTSSACATVVAVALGILLLPVVPDGGPPEPPGARVQPLAVVASGVVVPAVVVPAAAAPAEPLDPPSAPAVSEAPPSGGYAFLEPGSPGRPGSWDACRPVRYVLRPDGAPDGARELLAEAFGQLSAATGLRFVDDGLTDEAPRADRATLQPERYGDGWAPVLIAWSEPSESPELAGTTAGFAIPRWFDPDGLGKQIVTGEVVLDGSQLAGTGALPVVSVVLHELGHLVGLDHVPDPTDIMHARGVPATGYTPSALRGLRELVASC